MTTTEPTSCRQYLDAAARRIDALRALPDVALQFAYSDARGVHDQLRDAQEWVAECMEGAS